MKIKYFIIFALVLLPITSESFAQNSSNIDKQNCKENHILVDGKCMAKSTWDSSDFRGLQTGETISNPEVAIIIQSLGAILIILFIVIYAIKKRMKKQEAN